MVVYGGEVRREAIFREERKRSM